MLRPVEKVKKENLALFKMKYWMESINITESIEANLNGEFKMSDVIQVGVMYIIFLLFLHFLIIQINVRYKF